jgi:hypothetical protein
VPWNGKPVQEIQSARFRYIPDPLQVLLLALKELFAGAEQCLAAPDRVGLFIDPGESLQPLQHEFLVPLLQGEDAGPLLFPYTTDSMLVSHACIHFSIKGASAVLRSRDASCMLEQVRVLLRAGHIDQAVVGALHYAHPSYCANRLESARRRFEVPFIDCAACLLVDGDEPWPKLPAASRDFMARYGNTGRAGPFLQYLADQECC